MTCPLAYNGFVYGGDAAASTPYAGQVFTLTVTAKNAGDGTTANYNTTTGFAKTTTLDAFGALGTTTAVSGAGGLGVTSLAQSDFAEGAAITATQQYKFDKAPTAPTNIYVRASDGETSSLRVTDPTTTSVEGGVTVVSGRLKVTNAYGSELLPLSLTATVQYFSAIGWVNSITDSITRLTLADTYDVSNKGTKNGTTTPAPKGEVAVVNGQRTIVLGKPTGGGTGTATVNPAAPAYLPVTPGAATFGVYKGSNEFIYMREAY
jgi:MSHA biogenesis protein MshQ